jgi:mRNA-degrading endonuclease RelE of RelBE toxin-antitoxin system
VLDSVDRHLTDQPAEATQKRKLLAENRLGTWELRLGDLRVFYDVNSEENAVEVVAVGVKEHNRLRIGGEEVEL